MKSIIFTGFALSLYVLCALTLGGCGKEKASPDAPTPHARVAPSMTAAERAKYCFVWAQGEADPKFVETFLAKLEGKWSFVSNDSDTRGAIKKLTFSAADHRVSLGLESISYRRACISQELGADWGDFAGFRVLEFMADNNEGGVAFAVRVKGPTEGLSASTLQMTTYRYKRWAAEGSLMTLSELFKDSVISTFSSHE